MSIFYKLFKEKFWEICFISIIVFGLGVLISAYSIDYILGFEPCILCIYQRIPYFLMIIFAALGLLVKKYRYLSLQLIIFCSISGAGLAIYHTGVERFWWNPAFNCSANLDLEKDSSYEEFLKDLDDAPISDCTKAAMHIAGFSLAEINIVINFIILAIVINLVKLYAKTYIRPK